IVGPSNVAARPTYGKSSFIDASQLPDDPDMPELEDITYSDNEDDVSTEADFNNLETSITSSPIPTTRVHKDHLEEPKRIHQALKYPSWIEAMQEELLQFKMQKVWVLVDLPQRKRAIATKWVYRNKKDERGIVIRNKAILRFRLRTEVLTLEKPASRQLMQKKEEEKKIEEAQAANARYWKIPTCYDDDDDYNFALTPNKPVNSLSIRDEHPDTISATKSNEFIKSSVENLVLIPSESEGDSECDVPVCEEFTTFLNVLFDADYEFDSSDNQPFSNEDAPEKIFLNPLFEEEIIPMKIDQHHYNDEFDITESLRIDETDCDPEEDIRLIKKLLYDNSSPRLPEEFNNDEDAAFNRKEHDFDVKKPESEVSVSPSSSAQSKKQDDKTKKETRGKSPVESFIGYKDLSAEFEDCSDNSINE
nr:putative ribonuclease H-like domain-containing protein [Tanacetum cinerariifolium]